MKKRLSAFALSGLIALGMLAGSLAPATAGVVNPGTPTVTANNDVVNVRDRHWRRHHRHYRHHRHHRRHYRSGGGIYFQFGSPGYYGPGYYPRYYRPPTYHTRPRYVAPRYVAPAYGLSRAHIRWCYNRYRSYRASDNTFQPYHGPRQQCYSPYR